MLVSECTAFLFLMSVAFDRAYWPCCSHIIRQNSFIQMYFS